VILWIIIQKNINEIYTPEMYTSYEKNIDKSIITYNIQKFPWALKSLKDKEIYDLVRSHSIVLLQECFCEAYDNLEKHYPDYNICRGNLKGFNAMNSGLVTLSKFPIIDVKFYQYKSYNPLSFDMFSEKGFLSVLVDVGGNSDKRYIRVINTHLQSSDFQRYDKNALSQMKELLVYLEELRDSGVEYIVGGDFNVDIRDIKGFDNVKESGDITELLDKVIISYPNDPTIYINLSTSHSSSKNIRGYEQFIFDYFISSKGLKVRDPVVISSNYSDHNPVSSIIEM
jgi:endonuclease/exonuclease/phosphatase family metal-dependent hydrolase